MESIRIAVEKARIETNTNRKRALHNVTCKKVDDLQPYDSTEYVNMVSVVLGYLRTQGIGGPRAD